MSFPVVRSNNRCFYCYGEFSRELPPLKPDQPNGCIHRCHVGCEKPALIMASFLATVGRERVNPPLRFRVHCVICQNDHTYEYTFNTWEEFQQFLESRT